MNLVHISTVTFLLLSLVIALAPLRFLRATAGPPIVTTRNVIALQSAWAVWVTVWGTLAILTTADLPYGIPQTFRFLGLFVAPVLVGSGLLLFVPLVRERAASIPLISLVRWQRYRVVGGFFLVGAAAGDVSLPFAVIAGIGDIIVGVAAAVAARRMVQQPDRATQIAQAHARLGMTDFTIAVGTAILSRAEIGWPYSLIPLFLVPMAILGHVVTLQRKPSEHTPTI